MMPQLSSDSKHNSAEAFDNSVLQSSAIQMGPNNSVLNPSIQKPQIQIYTPLGDYGNHRGMLTNGTSTAEDAGGSSSVGDNSASQNQGRPVAPHNGL